MIQDVDLTEEVVAQIIMKGARVGADHMGRVAEELGATPEQAQIIADVARTVILRANADEAQAILDERNR